MASQWVWAGMGQHFSRGFSVGMEMFLQRISVGKVSESPTFKGLKQHLNSQDIFSEIQMWFSGTQNPAKSLSQFHSDSVMVSLFFLSNGGHVAKWVACDGLLTVTVLLEVISL